MTATDELRRMLDERGVEWMPIAWNPKKETFYHTSNGVGFCADEYTGGVRVYTDATITPEQAIEATMGRGTCKVDTEESLFLNIQRWHICGCCGTGFSLWYYTEDGDECEETPHYCPNCGRRVVS